MTAPPQAPERHGQDEASAAANAEYFAGERHGEHASTIDSYLRIREALDSELAGIDTLLDVGNGGVFEYDTGAVGSIVAVDLFLDELPEGHFPPNVTPRQGSALELGEPEDRYEAVLQAMLYHHLVGRTPEEMIANVRTAIAEAARVLRPGGMLIVAEPCVPRWFFAIERLAFRAMRALAGTRLFPGHPPTLQLTPGIVEGLISERLEIERSYRIPRGRWTTLLGRKIPAILFPSRMRMVVARKPAAAPPSS
jgi:SAM-dependent methyltransferase